MALINILDDATVNRIAAGEVVERPVNVVKELVENALDAKATSVSIEIRGGGIDLIRITDNGTGIPGDNIRTAFLRHATSKITCIDDLMRLSSLGFRGEALSSIASVAQVELMTRTAGSLVGFSYRIEGGRELSLDEAGVPEGTTVIIRNLFFNTPARRKFLKSATTEASYITELVEKLILSHPDVSFKYTLNNSVKLTGNGLGDIMSDIYSLYGRDTVNSLNEVKGDGLTCSIRGFAGKPEISRGNRNHEIFFVNGRFIKSRVLTAAVEEAYKPFLMQHRFPFVVLYLDIPSELIDVNVHPSKTEIKFAEETEVYSCTLTAVSESLRKRELIPEPEHTIKHNESLRSDPESNKPHFLNRTDVPEPFETKRSEEFRKKEHEEIRSVMSEDTPVQETLFKEGLLMDSNRPRHKIVGQVFDTYWIIEFEGKMYIVDQHAAHEKVLYERILRQKNENRVYTQMISPPFILTLSAAEEDAVKANITSFEQFGFRIEHFGGREYALCGVPAELYGMMEQDYFLSVVDSLVDQNTAKEPDEVFDRIATMSCKAAVKGNMRMSTAEADALIDELLKLDNPYNCPHGRPTIIAFSRQDIDRMFKRIV